MKHEVTGIQSKDKNIGLYIINTTSLSSNNHKNVYLKMDIVGYYILINLLANHKKNNFFKYRQLNLIFTLRRTAILFIVFFPTHYKSISISLLNNNYFLKIQNNKIARL